MAKPSLPCPKCGARLPVDVSMIGRKVKCNECGRKMFVTSGGFSDSRENSGESPSQIESVQHEPEATQGKRGQNRIALYGAATVLALLFFFALGEMWKARKSRQLQAATAKVHELKAQADGLRSQKKFADAKSVYEEALVAIDELPEDKRKIKPDILAALESDDIRLGSNPAYVEFEGKWLTKGQMAVLLAQRFKAEQEAKGLVEFQGKWMRPEERERILGEQKLHSLIRLGENLLSKKSYSEAKAKYQEALGLLPDGNNELGSKQEAEGLVEFQGRWVHPEEYERLKLKEDIKRQITFCEEGSKREAGFEKFDGVWAKAGQVFGAEKFEDLVKSQVGAEKLRHLLSRASVNGNYSQLAKVFVVPGDKSSSGEFKDYGPGLSSTYKGHRVPDRSYWVYVYPYWFVWARSEKAEVEADEANRRAEQRQAEANRRAEQRRTVGDEYSARSVAERFVKRKLAFPEEAKFPWGSSSATLRGDGVWVVRGEVVAKNPYGVRIRYNWVVLTKLQEVGGGTWTCVEVTLWESR